MRDVADEVPRWERGLAWAIRAALIAMAAFHTVTGDYLLVAYCLLALGILLAPPMLARSSGANVPVELELVVVVLVVTDMILGKWLGLYDRIVYWDKAIHLGNSGLLGFLGFLVLFVLRSAGLLRASVGISIVITTWLTLGLGAAWEIGEYVMDQIFGTATQGSPVTLPLDDTMWDLIFDAIGGVIGGALGVVYLHRSTRARRVARWFHGA